MGWSPLWRIEAATVRAAAIHPNIACTRSGGCPPGVSANLFERCCTCVLWSTQCALLKVILCRLVVRVVRICAMPTQWLQRSTIQLVVEDLCSLQLYCYASVFAPCNNHHFQLSLYSTVQCRVDRNLTNLRFLYLSPRVELRGKYEGCI